jgi:hypothetical protein
MKIPFKMKRIQLKGQRRRQPSLCFNLVDAGLGLLLCGLIVLLSACSSSSPGSGSSSTDTTANTPMATATTAPTASSSPASALPTITLQVVGCPASTINWDSVVGTQAHVDKVQKVICGTLEGVGMQALVTVRHYTPDARLDVYVYDNIAGTPVRRFSIQGLINGDAFISSVRTLVTAESNPGDVIKGALDLFKEYKWNGTAFGQVIFPGMFPDMTRYQADQDQAQVNAELATLQPGQPKTLIRDSWKLSAGAVATHLAQAIFHWQHVTTTLPQGAAKLSIIPVTVTNPGTGGGGFIATVHHLNEVTTNIFEVWQVTSMDGNSVISSPGAYAQLRSPVSVSGSAMASGSVLGRVVVYDDAFVTIGAADLHGAATTGIVQFTNTVTYQLSGSGLQEGTVAFYATNQNNTAITNQVVMVKVFLAA